MMQGTFRALDLKIIDRGSWHRR